MPRRLGQVNRAQGLERGVFANPVKLEAERHSRAGGGDRDSAEPRGQCGRQAWVVLPIVIFALLTNVSLVRLPCEAISSYSFSLVS